MKKRGEGGGIREASFKLEKAYSHGIAELKDGLHFFGVLFRILYAACDI
jgi:hypothetical protein